MHNANSAMSKIVAAAQSAVAQNIRWKQNSIDRKDGSPIETLFRVALETYVEHVFPYVFEGVLYKPSNIKFEEYCNEKNLYSLLVEQQAQIGRHRVDFLLVSYDFANSQWNEACTQPIYDQLNWKRLIVECDGHDFHERTKEQAAADKSRDRELAMAGFTVFRFTGSEIWRNPMGCAEQAFDWAKHEIPKWVAA